MAKLLKPVNLLFLGLAYMAYGWKGVFWVTILLLILIAIVVSNKDLLEELIKKSKENQ